MKSSVRYTAHSQTIYTESVVGRLNSIESVLLLFFSLFLNCVFCHEEFRESIRGG